MGYSHPLSREEKILLQDIALASDQRSWQKVQSRFARYTGQAIQIYTAVINAALRCGRYKEGVSIYQTCRETCKTFDEVAFTSIIRIFGKLKESAKVQETWEVATKECALSQILVSSRIHAAADMGDVETAAEMLDLLNSNDFEINAMAITSAIRSCWGWGVKQHRAARYFWDLFQKYKVKRDIAAFAALVGAYQTAPLEDVLAAKAEMDSIGIEPNRVFAETYVATVLQQNFMDLRGVDAIVQALTDKPGDRLQAARETLEDYEARGVEMTSLCRKVKRALQILQRKP